MVKTFWNKKIMEQFFVLNERIDIYLRRHKLVIEVDELGHLDRDEEAETKRQKKNYENILTAHFLELTPIKKILTFLSSLVKEKVTLVSQIKN